jgi:uncharacterized protein YhbP (UPF0306 family)
MTNRTKSFLKSLVKHMDVWTILLLSVLLTACFLSLQRKLSFHREHQ